MKRLLILFSVMIFILCTGGIASANTIASSTMWFQGSLTSEGGGYTGTIDAIAGTYYIAGGLGTSIYSGSSYTDNAGNTVDDGDYITPDGCLAEGGFDVYAKVGASAYYDDVYQGTIGADHDGYPGPSGGGWGQFYTPDVRDWTNYQLTLTTDQWYLEYKGTALGTPMSGSMNWSAMFAEETDTGSYRGTPPSDPDANDGGAAALGGGPGAWDMDWTWGSEVIPLEYSGFNVGITPLGEGVYKVSMTPAPIPGAVWLLGSGLIGLVGLRRRFRS